MKPNTLSIGLSGSLICNLIHSLSIPQWLIFIFLAKLFLRRDVCVTLYIIRISDLVILPVL